MKFVLPEKRLLAVVIILSIVGPVQYLYDVAAPPAGKTFVGYPDDAMMITLMKSAAFNFNDPWSIDGGKVWHNPLIGSSYLFIILGALPVLLKTNIYAFFVLLKFVFGVIYFLVAYNLISEFFTDARQKKIAFLIFMLAAGIGGILYIFSSIVFAGSKFLPVIGYAFTREFDELAAVAHSLTHIFRLYYMIPELLGYLSLLFFMRKRTILAGISLGLAFLFYPMHGIAFSVILLFYLLATHFDASFFKKFLYRLMPVFIIAGLFMVPWFLSFHERPYYIEMSRTTFEALPPLNLVVSFFFPLCLIAIFLKKMRPGLLKSKVFAVIFLVILFLFSLETLNFTAQTSTLFSEWLSSINLLWLIKLLYSISLPLEMLMIAITVVLAASILVEKTDAKIKFLLIWGLVFFVLSGVQPWNLGYLVNTVRFAPSLILPISVLAAFGVAMLSKKIGIGQMKIIAVIIILSLPSLFGYAFWLQKSARQDYGGAFVSADDYNALVNLSQLPDGRVMSTLAYGPYIPFYSGKSAMSFSGRSYPGMLDNANNAIKEFYSQNSTVAARQRIISDYNITYVFIGSKDPIVEMPSSAKLIFDSGSKIFRT